jgi:hypothetical protein
MGNFKGDSNSRRIDRALQHVNKPWFPMNPEVLKRVRDGLESGIYENNFNALLADLKTDFALFTFLVKELAQRAVTAEESQALLANPLELIRWGSSTHMKEILSEQQKVPTMHSLHWSEPFQIQRLRETAIIATTASVLSEQKNLDPELGFSRGVIREIGLNLIAWNYPSVYTQVISRLKPEQVLDDELAKELGFTPALLAMRLMRPDAGGDSGEEITEDSSWATYDELCEIGENLARAENPETYPSAENDWKKAKAFLTTAMGEKAIDLIRDRVVESSQQYKKSLPEVFGTLDRFDPQKNIEKHKRAARAIEDRYLKFCSEGVQKALKEMYSEMSNESVNKALVGRLLKDIVPEAGFTGGCVFVVDPSSLSLKPRTLIGKVQMRKISNVELEPGDAAVSALASPQPVIQVSEDLANSAFTGIYSSLGSRKKVGVLYLEKPQPSSTKPDDGTMGVFEVIRKALCDALLIE